MNDAQKEAVTHGEGPLLVLAGPGSGKTFTITRRILYLLEERSIPPEQILVITFTKAAALSMQSRFKEQSTQLYPVNFGTFHSCFYHILRQSHMLQQHRIAAEADKKDILKYLFSSGVPVGQSVNPSVNQTENHPNGSSFPNQSLIPSTNQTRDRTTNPPKSLASNRKESIVCDKEIASRFLQAFSFYKNTGDETGAAKKLPMEYQASFLPVFQAYEKERERRGLLDFDDMVYLCHRLLSEDASLRAYWQSRFSHILMDEFQDINPMQYEVVKLLAGDGAQLFAVGDDDQSIYGFRGSKPACLKQFQEEFQAKIVYLSLNYRSTPQIVEASLKIISENKQRFEKDLKSIQAQDSHFSQVGLKSFEEREEQYAYLAQRLKTILEETKESPENFPSLGVLFRTNSYMQGVAARLSRLGIPYDMKEKVTSIYGHFIVKDIMAYLQLAEGEGGREALLQILNKPLRYLGREALGWQGNLRQQALTQQNITQQNISQRNLSSPDLLSQMLEEMHLYYKTASDIAYRQERILAVEKLKKDFRLLKGRPLYLKVQYILKGMGYEKYLKDSAGTDMEKWQEYQEILEWLSGEAKVYEEISMWLRAKENYENNLKEESGKDPKDEEARKTPKIHLMTVHASKGLEFDHVWIPDCNEKVFPHGNMPDASCCEEERRIFYVAMTRAKKSLELLYLTGTKERPRLPSRFLNPLLQSPANSSNSQLSRYSSNASATLSYSSSSSI